MKSVLAWMWRMIFSPVKSVLAWIWRRKFLTAFFAAGAFVYWLSDQPLMPYEPYCTISHKRIYLDERLSPLYRRSVTMLMKNMGVRHAVRGDRVLVSWRFWLHHRHRWGVFINPHRYDLGRDVTSNAHAKSVLSAIYNLREADTGDPEISALLAKLDANHLHLMRKFLEEHDELMKKYASLEPAPLSSKEKAAVRCELQKRAMTWGLEDESGGG